MVQVQLLVMRDAILTALEMLLYAFTGAAFPDARPPCMLLQDCPWVSRADPEGLALPTLMLMADLLLGSHRWLGLSQHPSAFPAWAWTLVFFQGKAKHGKEGGSHPCHTCSTCRSHSSRVPSDVPSDLVAAREKTSTINTWRPFLCAQQSPGTLH